MAKDERKDDDPLVKAARSHAKKALEVLRKAQLQPEVMAISESEARKLPEVEAGASSPNVQDEVKALESDSAEKQQSRWL